MFVIRERLYAHPVFSGIYLKKLNVSMVPSDGENLDLRSPPGEVFRYMQTEEGPASEMSCF